MCKIVANNSLQKKRPSSGAGATQKSSCWISQKKKKNSNDYLMVIPEQYIIIITVVWDYFNDHIILNTKHIHYYISPTTVNKNSIQLHNTSCGVYVYPTRGHLSLKCTIHVCYILLQITRQFLLFFLLTRLFLDSHVSVFSNYI